MTLVLIGSALIPVIAVIIYIYFKDKYEKEPLSLLILSFFLGILSVIPAIALESLAEGIGMGTSSDIIQTAIFALIGVGFSEEFSKFLFLRLFIFKKKEFNEPFDGIIYAVMISMGFGRLQLYLHTLHLEFYWDIMLEKQNSVIIVSFFY